MERKYQNHEQNEYKQREICGMLKVNWINEGKNDGQRLGKAYANSSDPCKRSKMGKITVVLFLGGFIIC